MQTPLNAGESKKNSSNHVVNEESGFLFNKAGGGVFDETTVLVLVYFCIAEMSVEVQSLGKSIVELQVTGVKASLTKRLCDTSLGLSVHSLLLVDAIQTLGSNFELLAASHKNVTVDSVSGSLRGSDPVSPASPHSPMPPSMASTSSAYKSTSPSDIARALSALQRSKVQHYDSNKALGEFVDPDSLISIEVTHVDRSILDETSASEQSLIVSIQFNSLDIIANQETIIELIYFARRIMPDSLQAAAVAAAAAASSNKRRRRMPTKEQSCQTEDDPISASQSWHELDGTHECSGGSHTKSSALRTDVTADFQRLNVLLLRAVTGKMIGTALLTEARIHIKLSEAVCATGSLGGLQVHSLLPGSQLHQRIISVGKDPTAEDTKKVRDRTNIHSELYLDPKSAFQHSNEQRAFSFVINYKTLSGGQTGGPMTTTTPMHEMGPGPVEVGHKIEIELRMASVCYLHSMAFIRELNSCAADFLHFLSQVATSITTAATDLALGIVQRRTESISFRAEMNDIYAGNLDPFPVPAPTSTSDHYGSLERGASARLFAPAPTPSVNNTSMGGMDIRLDVVLETPIIVLPRTDRSNEVLVGHLGLITIRNETFRGFLVDRTDQVLITIENMNVHSLDLMDQIRAYHHRLSDSDDLLEMASFGKTLSAVELYSCSATQVASPILHDTEVSVCLERRAHYQASSASFSGKI